MPTSSPLVSLVARATIALWSGALFFILGCASGAARSPQTPVGVSAPSASVALDRDPEIFYRQALVKRLTDLSFYSQLGMEMIVRKAAYSGEDQMIIPAYVFAPRDTARRYPLVLMVHGGIHGDFDDGFVPYIRSLVHRGYVVIAPEYRGSTGYGPAHYDAIDYGGKEVEDVIAARAFAGALLPFADTSRTAIMGWSHGGFITLHSILRRPELFKVAIAHVPVADLPTRIRTHSEAYHRLFVNQKGFGARLEQDPRPYIERSPIAHVRRLRTPLLVLAADNDDDVYIVENHNLRDSMRVAGMEREGLYTYREWHNPPGGHGFSRVDTPEGRESWSMTLEFLRKHLAQK
jgi:dipeptidyl aminopeptidase/acylaminoacyl peptidase